jgi:hypothetical protein
MLKELVAYYQSIQQQQFHQQVTKVLSDISKDMSDLLWPLPVGSPISIDMPDIMIFLDISMHPESDHTSATSIISSDSEVLITDFEVEYYQNWRH